MESGSSRRDEAQDGVIRFDFADELGRMIPRYAGSDLANLKQLVEQFYRGNSTSVVMGHIEGATVDELAGLYGMTKGDVVSMLREAIKSIADFVAPHQTAKIHRLHHALCLICTLTSQPEIGRQGRPVRVRIPNCFFQSVIVDSI